MTNYITMMIMMVMCGIAMASMFGAFRIYRRASIQQKLVNELQYQITCNNMEIECHKKTVSLFSWFMTELIDHRDDTLVTQFKLNNLAAALTILELKLTPEVKFGKIRDLLASSSPEDVIDSMQILLEKYYSYDPDTKDCVKMMIYMARGAYEDFDMVDEKRRRVFDQLVREMENNGIHINRDVKVRGKFSGTEPTDIDPIKEVKQPNLFEIKNEIDKLVESGTLNLTIEETRENEEVIAEVPVEQHETQQEDGEIPNTDVQGETQTEESSDTDRNDTYVIEKVSPGEVIVASINPNSIMYTPHLEPVASATPTV